MNMKLKKIITINLMALMFFSNNSACSYSIKQSPLDIRYETFQGSNIEINDILEESAVNVELEGNTLVNLFDDKNATVSVSGKSKFISDGLTRLKNKTVYTIIPINYPVDITGITIQNEVKGAGWWYSYLAKITNSNPIVITTPDSWLRPGTTSYYTEMRLIVSADREMTAEELDNLKFMILEGNWIDKDIPKYFEGIKSVGQNSENGHGIEILSTGKNIIKPQVLLNRELGGSVSMIQRNATEEVIIKPDTLYTFTMKDKRQQPYIRFYDANKNFIKSYGGGTNTKKVKGLSPSNAKYLVCYVYSSNIILDKENEIIDNEWCVVEGENDAYFPYQSNSMKILLNEPLRGLPNGVKDKIIEKEGKWFIERNCAEIVLDSFEGQGSIKVEETINNYSSRIYMSYAANTRLPNIKQEADECGIISNRLPSKKVVSSMQSEGEMAIGKTSAGISVRCKGVSVEECTNWIKNNPLTIIYQLESPIYEYLEIVPKVDLYKETTYITTNSNISPNLKFIVDRVANRAREAIELAKIYPTTENLAIARMWIDLMQDSILKDELHEEVSNIINMDDLEIERKKISSNMDLYVRPQNMLSMSLSTNSVTFENYSGVEDMELLNIMSINISSSLPYSLNVYIKDEISNKDKTKTIDVKTLNIRESYKSEYKQFNAINEKIVLRENCEVGNRIIHNIDLKLSDGKAYNADVYKTVIKFEAEQK